MLKEYKESLKKVEVEETVDLFVFRPIAFALVKILYKTTITPNQISFIAMLLGAAAGGFLAWGTKVGFLVGGLILIASHIFDCSDGMIARLKNNGTKIGRVIDGIADYFTFIFVYVGTAVGLSKMESANQISFPVNVWVAILAIAFFHIIHSIITDFYRNKYLYNVYNQKIDPQTQRLEFEKEYEDLTKKKGRVFEKVVVLVYLKYTILQSTEETKVSKKYDGKSYAKNNKILIRLWNLIGNSTHIFVFSLAAILFKPTIYAFYALIAANIWMLLLFIIQLIVDKKTRLDA